MAQPGGEERGLAESGREVLGGGEPAPGRPWLRRGLVAVLGLGLLVVAGPDLLRSADPGGRAAPVAAPSPTLSTPVATPTPTPPSGWFGYSPSGSGSDRWVEPTLWPPRGDLLGDRPFHREDYLVDPRPD